MLVAATIPIHHHHHHHRIYASLFAIAKFTTMASTSSSSNNSGAFTTIKERVTFEKDIKKSKFIAIAGSVSDDKSAMSFLSQVTYFPFLFLFFVTCWIIWSFFWTLFIVRFGIQRLLIIAGLIRYHKCFFLKSNWH